MLTLVVVRGAGRVRVELERVCRVSSVIGTGPLLLVTSYVYNRARAASS